jgi:hypothetical protein
MLLVQGRLPGAAAWPPSAVDGGHGILGGVSEQHSEGANSTDVTAGVGKTALGVAMVTAQESRRGDRLFGDRLVVPGTFDRMHAGCRAAWVPPPVSGQRATTCGLISRSGVISNGLPFGARTCAVPLLEP